MQSFVNAYGRTHAVSAATHTTELIQLAKKMSKDKIVLLIPAYFAYLYNRLHEGQDVERIN